MMWMLSTYNIIELKNQNNKNQPNISLILDFNTATRPTYSAKGHGEPVTSHVKG